MLETVAPRIDSTSEGQQAVMRAEHRGEPSLRVLTFVNSLAPGGVERVALRLHAAWRAVGVDARLVIADETVSAPHPIAACEMLGRHAHPLARFVALVTRLPAIIARERPDILFCAGNTYSGAAVVLKLVLGRNCPVIVAKISNDLVRRDMPVMLRWWYRRWLRLQGRCIDHFVGMAPAMRDEIVDLIGVPDHRVHIVEDPALTAADCARLATARGAAVRSRAGRHYLAVGRLVAQKNFALLIDAFADIRRPGDTLTILGEGGERAPLERQAERRGIAASVALPGHVEPLDVWLARADAFVLSSDYEGVPAVLIEALAAGLPIVATDCCVSMGDLLGHGTLGHIVPVGDAAALAQAMAAIVETPCPAAAQHAAASRFTIEHATGRYLAVMRLACRPALNTRRSDPAPIPAA